MAKTWTAVVVTTSDDLAEAVGSMLTDLGAPGLVIEDVSDGTRITAHFLGDVPLDAIERFCSELPEHFPGSARPRIRVEALPDADWAENWKLHFPPLAIGERLYVHPPWIEEIPGGRVAVVIDPGMAFGTGHHASTLGCLLLLDRAMIAVSATRVLDIGTGSGILAIAAAKLGAREVWAVDTDPEACRVARANADANRVAARIQICPSLEAVSGVFDIVLANLFAQQLVELAREISNRVRPGGFAIGSGILAEEADTVARAWEGAGLAPFARHEEAGWMTIACRR